MNKKNLTNQNNDTNYFKMRKNGTLKNENQSLFIYDEQKNVLNLTAQLPHSFTLEKTLLTCILVNCDTSFQTLEVIMEHLPIDDF